MENLAMKQAFWQNKSVFITGHTGFKGSWLCLWLSCLGAKVTGFALPPPTTPSLFELAHVRELLRDHHTADVRNAELLSEELSAAQPEIVFHLAAQPLVRDSYKFPVDTYETNVMGTVHLLEAVRNCSSVKAVINVTTDKCYENREWVWGYRENDRLGGHDPYSNSKACSELVTAAYRASYFNVPDRDNQGAAVATARAGNVIGGGDWATDRLVPDVIHALLAGETISLRNPQATRPWQHVLDPLSGYLNLAQKLYSEGQAYAESWNFGPNDSDTKSVEWLVRRLCDLWENKVPYIRDHSVHPHEAHYLRLDCSKSLARLGWAPRWNLDKALSAVVEWTRNYCAGTNMQTYCLKQISDYTDA